MAGLGTAVSTLVKRTRNVYNAVTTDTEVYQIDKYVEALGEMFGIHIGVSGKTVNERTAMKVAVVYACTRLISGAIAQMPIHVYNPLKTGGKERADPLIEKLFRVSPNQKMSGYEFKEWVIQKCLLRGKAFAIIGRTRNGVPVELFPIEPGNMIVRENDFGGYDYIVPNWLFPNGTRGYAAFHQDDVLHFRGFAGMSVISAGALNATGLEMAMEDYSGDFFVNGALQSMAIIKDGIWGEEQRNAVRSQWLQRYGRGLESKKLPLVFDKTVDIKRLDINAKDSQLLESREFQITDIARAFGVPSFMVNQEQKSSSWGTGVAEIGQVFVRYTLGSHIHRTEGEIERKFYPRSVKMVEMDSSVLTRATEKDRYASHRIALGGGQNPGFKSVNEIRTIEGLPPAEGEEYDKPHVPSVQTSTEEEPSDPEDPENPDEEEDDEQEEEASRQPPRRPAR